MKKINVLLPLLFLLFGCENNANPQENKAIQSISKKINNVSENKLSHIIEETNTNDSRVEKVKADYSLVGNWENTHYALGYQWFSFYAIKSDNTYKYFTTSSAGQGYRFGSYKYESGLFIYVTNKGEKGAHPISWIDKNSFVKTESGGRKYTYYRTNKTEPKEDRIMICPYCGGEAQLSVCDLNVASCLTASQSAYDCNYKIDCCKCKGTGKIKID